MSIDRFLLALCVAALCALSQGALAAPRLYITTETSPPASMSDRGRVIGTGTDKVREIMSRSGIDYSIELLPWKRAYTAALTRPDACVFSTTRTSERENLFKWVGPTDEAEWVLLGRADRALQINSLEDARTLRIGTYNGDARDEYLRTRGFQVDPAPNDMINPRKLLMNRIDLWAASLRRGSAVLEQNGWADRIVPVFTFAKVRVYLACNPAIPDELIARMNDALEAMSRDGTLRRIERKYENWIELKGPVQ
jgi:polar amino acid transport system substrate-binding protein